MLDIKKTALIVIDVQGNLAQVMHRKEELFKNLKIIIKGVQALEIPILWTEQNPEGLGPTIPEIAGLMTDIKPISKLSFSCCRNRQFIEALKSIDRPQLLITGIETHICIYQTALDLVGSGYEVEVVTDCVSSRTHENKTLALQKMNEKGVGLTSAEMALFELLKVAEGEQFKKVLKILK